MISDGEYMQRCIDLAGKAAGYVAPNPMVGAVLVHEDRIIGEGYHQMYGQAHAEVNCIRQAEQQHHHLLEHSRLYVSLEPCSHFGKTPPCASLLIEKKIKTVIIGCRDPFAEVNGKGIEKLKAAGVYVTIGILENECVQLNKRFFTFHNNHRPYIILKWAASADHKIAAYDKNRTFISNAFSNRLVHKWRAEEASILIGTNTALSDDPSLTTRLWKGSHPIRLVLDRHLRLPGSLKVFDQSVSTIVFNEIKEEENHNLRYVYLDPGGSVPEMVATALYRLNIQSVMIEGGAILLQSFIDAGIWDEARIITNKDLIIGKGINAPTLNTGIPCSHTSFGSDSISFYRSPTTIFA